MIWRIYQPLDSLLKASDALSCLCNESPSREPSSSDHHNDETDVGPLRRVLRRMIRWRL